jgi:enterochelin esterase family protein
MIQPFRTAPTSVYFRWILILAFAFGTAALAQTTAPSTSQPAAKKAAPVPLVAAPAADPEVKPDGTATFRLAMPNAQKVELDLEGQHDPIPMTKAADGAWTLTVPALAPQYYSYVFLVDGTEVLDPHNTDIKTSFFVNQNIFLVPGQPAMPWEMADVPHGVVHHHYYKSKIVGIDSEYYVYTPPGFDPHTSQKYPVLYLLHGYSDDPSAWTAMGKANVILDNLIAAGKAKPMIVVMPWGYGDMRVGRQQLNQVRRSLISGGDADGEAAISTLRPARGSRYRRPFHGRLRNPARRPQPYG